MGSTTGRTAFAFGTCLVLLIATTARSSVESARLVISPSGTGFTPEDGRLNWPSGKPLNLTCSVVGAGPETKYRFSWRFDRWPRLHLPAERASRATFSFRLAQPSDSGIYGCSAIQVSDPSARLDSQIILHVWAPSDGCGPFFFMCPETGYCIGKRYLCDGKADCRDGADESEGECGYGDPCSSKLPCQDGRCMDPSLCCDPMLQPNCTVVPKCCSALVESNRRYFELGVGQSKDMQVLHSTLYAALGGTLAIVVVLLAMVLAVCRLQLKRGRLFRRPSSSRPRGASRSHPPITLHDLDVYFSALRAVDDRNTLEITYNINNGVQIVGAPPPYSLENEDPPPPYRESDAAVAAPRANQARIVQNQELHAANRQQNDREILREENNNIDQDEGNNNGDINGNSDMVDHNEVRRRQMELEREESERLLQGEET